MAISSAALLIVLIALPFGGSCLAALFRANARNAEAYLAGGVALIALVIVIAIYSQVVNGGVVQYTASWVPELGLEFNLRMDGFAWVLAALVTGIGFLVVLYARYYLSAADPVPRFFSFLLAFMGAMIGIVLSGNLIQLVFFWELTSLFSFLLIGYWHQTASARDGARMALIITSAGGLCLFAGILVLGHIVGSYDLDRVLAAGAAIRSHSLYIPALVLILLGALTKSAQFPFHFWLPHAMAAPTPVSAYLHSATMVKAGVFLLVRLWPALGGTNEWLWLVASTGLVTFILGAFIAVFQQDLKGLLAYSTISHLGLITLLIGLDTPLGQVAAIFHIMNHATFKASLFMAAGIIDHETGTRDIRRLSGLWRFMPITATLAMVAAAAMAGVPLLNGFLSKEMFFAETIEIHDNSLVDQALPYIVTAASMFTVAYSLRFIRDVFFGPPPQALPRTPREPPFLMRFPAELLVLACVVVGIVPAPTIGPLLETALHAVLGPAIPEYSLAVWHGFTFELLMSVVAISGGVAVYFMLHSSARQRRSAAAAPHQGAANFRLYAPHHLVADRKRVGESPGHASPATAVAAASLFRAFCRFGSVVRAWSSDAIVSARSIRVRVRDGLGCRDRVRFGGCLPGQVPPPCGARPAGRRRFDNVCQFRLAVGPRSRFDAAGRGNGHHGAVTPGAAMASEAHPRVPSACNAGKHHPMVSSPRLRYRCRGRIGVGCARLRHPHAPAAGEYLRFLCQECLSEERRN
jgi:multicomponent K+:H+ antiporter subunit A